MAAPTAPKMGTRIVFPIIFKSAARITNISLRKVFFEKYIPSPDVSAIVYKIGVNRRNTKICSVLRYSLPKSRRIKFLKRIIPAKITDIPEQIATFTSSNLFLSTEESECHANAIGIHVVVNTSFTTFTSTTILKAASYCPSSLNVEKFLRATLSKEFITQTSKDEGMRGSP